MTDTAPYRDLAAFRFALRQFLRFSDLVASSAGITTQQYQAMLAIRASSDLSMTVKEFAQELLLAHNGAVQLIDRLEAQALVKRNASSADGRKVMVSLTSEGEALLHKLAAEHLAELVRCEPLLAESLARLKALAG